MGLVAAVAADGPSLTATAPRPPSSLLKPSFYEALRLYSWDRSRRAKGREAAGRAAAEDGETNRGKRKLR